jgi:hypothetical protein
MNRTTQAFRQSQRRGMAGGRNNEGEFLFAATITGKTAYGALKFSAEPADEACMILNILEPFRFLARVMRGQSMSSISDRPWWSRRHPSWPNLP